MKAGIACFICGWTRAVPAIGNMGQALYHHWSVSSGHAVGFPATLDDSVPELSPAEIALANAYALAHGVGNVGLQGVRP